MCMFVKFRKRIETDLLYDKNNHIPRYFTLIVQTSFIIIYITYYVYSFWYATHVLTICVIYTLKINLLKPFLSVIDKCFYHERLS